MLWIKSLVCRIIYVYVVLFMGSENLNFFSKNLQRPNAKYIMEAFYGFLSNQSLPFTGS